ncbi:serine/threonine-protein kinase [Nocardia carnea]|uniref:serine/threonine-protein kinase n=1 Tax=Nocardia carnea TaxID=37328 RepID=UPI002455BAC1|nr:serine/threonine-protein kinase [Nocardia carnea]
MVAVHDRGSSDGVLWIAMQYVAGTDAGRAVRDGALPIGRALRIAAGTADALDHAHATGLVHRDVKLANILLRAADISAFPHGTLQEHVLLGDFGIAKAVAESTALTETGALVATVRYAAPEVLSGVPAGPASDQYSLACTLFHLLTGRPPFDADNTGTLVTAHLIHPPPRSSAIRAGLPRPWTMCSRSLLPSNRTTGSPRAAPWSRPPDRFSRLPNGTGRIPRSRSRRCPGVPTTRPPRR